MSISNRVGPLTRELIASFQENGLRAIDRLVPVEDLEPIEIEYAELLERAARWPHRDRKIDDTYASLPFGQHCSQINSVFPDPHRFPDNSLPLLNEDIDADTFCMHAGPAAFNVMRQPKLLDIVEAIIGGEIHSSPVQRVRMKPPARTLGVQLADRSNADATTWHQDMVARLPEADDTEKLTVWRPKTEATVENGCLTSIPGSCREGPEVHCSELAIASEQQVPDSIVQDQYSRPLPGRKGGAVVFHKMNVQRAPPNLPDGPGWSMNLRYHPIGQSTGRPAFPGFAARSRTNPQSVLADPGAWSDSQDEARNRIVSGDFKGRLFEDARRSNAAVC